MPRQMECRDRGPKTGPFRLTGPGNGPDAFQEAPFGDSFPLGEAKPAGRASPRLPLQSLFGRSSPGTPQHHRQAAHPRA